MEKMIQDLPCDQCDEVLLLLSYQGWDEITVVAAIQLACMKEVDLESLPSNAMSIQVFDICGSSTYHKVLEKYFKESLYTESVE
ncbi:hypothetical protein QJS04_geneDACA013172 [Acorus gramineus]|uniref:Uncharacterized protein n=1 Tax=Acorus gramineus TaxID=55184 RepID=A0AAV9BB63_ACOGR|nr:hypothetical protein QJS04_geneDACA013172 [Acorus gramineus]